MSKLSGLIFLVYDEVLVANDVTDACPGLRGCAGVYTLLGKAAGSGMVGTCLECSSSESPPCEVTELARPLYRLVSSGPSELSVEIVYGCDWRRDVSTAENARLSGEWWGEAADEEVKDIEC
jgi:hypothetical protein